MHVTLKNRDNGGLEKQESRGLGLWEMHVAVCSNTMNGFYRGLGLWEIHDPHCSQ